MWDHDWNARKEGLAEWMNMGLEKLTSTRYIRTRVVLKGGRTNVFQMYKKYGKGGIYQTLILLVATPLYMHWTDI